MQIPPRNDESRALEGPRGPRPTGLPSASPITLASSTTPSASSILRWPLVSANGSRPEPSLAENGVRTTEAVPTLRGTAPIKREGRKPS